MGKDLCRRGGRRLRVIVPCHDEEMGIRDCLDALLEAAIHCGPAAEVEIVVIANGCADGTIPKARAWSERLAGTGIGWRLIGLPCRSKSDALNAGWPPEFDGIGIVIDADVIVAPDLLTRMSEALATPAPRFAGGRLVTKVGRSVWSRAYADAWTNLSFIRDGASGCGVYAANVAGRRRWAAFPDLIADDLFVRSRFAESERIQVDASYSWPVPEGLANLIRARWRWMEGNIQFRRRFPEASHGRPWAARAVDTRRMATRCLASSPAYILIYAVTLVLALLTVRDDIPHWRNAR